MIHAINICCPFNGYLVVPCHSPMCNIAITHGTYFLFYIHSQSNLSHMSLRQVQTHSHQALYVCLTHLSVITASPLTTPLSIFQVGTHFFVHTGHGEECLMHSSINGSEIWCLFKATLPCIQCWSHGQDSNWRHLSSATQDVEDQCYGFCGLMALLWLSSGVQDFFVSGLSLVCVHTICHLESGWVSQLWCLTNV